MRRLETEPIERFNETPIDQPALFEVALPAGNNLDYRTLIGNTPAVTSTYDCRDDPQLVISADTGLPAWDEAAHYPVGRFDGIHGRTLEVLADQVYIEDEFKNQYFSLCIKGCDLSDPHFFKTLTAARGHIIYGLQESIVMERVIRASRRLRESGVATEYICGLVLPTKFPLDRQDTGIDHKDVVELPELLEHLSTRFADDPRNHNGKSPFEIKAEMIDRFKDCDYLISYRAMDCPYRFGELEDSEKFQAFQQFITKSLGTTDMGKFIERYDVEQYIKSLFVYNLARNVAGMHNAGIHHGFLVKLNISALGSIIDLDSCRGETLDLGDPPTTTKEEINDVVECLRTVTEVLSEVQIPDLGSRVKNIVYRQSCIHNAAVSFLHFYLAARFDTRREQTDFLASMLLHAESTKDRHDPDNDELHVYQVAQQVFDTYHMFARPEDAAVVPGFEIPDSSFRRSASLLKTVPPKFFKDNRALVLDDRWTMNKEYEAEFKTKRPIYSPLRPVLQNILFEQIFAAEAKNEKAQLLAAQLLFLVGCSFDRYQPRRTDRKTAVNDTKQYLRDRTESLIDRLEEVETEAIGDVLRPLLATKLIGMEDQIGTIDLTGEGEPDIDVLYLESDDQYRTALDALGVNATTPIGVLDGASTRDFIRGRHHLNPDSVIIADSKIVEWVAEQTTRESIARVLLSARPNAKPLLIVSATSTNEPIVLVQLSPFIDMRKDYVSLDDLLAGVAPSVTPFQPTLFQPQPPQYTTP